MKKSLHRLAVGGALVAQALVLTLGAPVPAGAEPAPKSPATATTAAATPDARFASRVTVKPGWELARIRAYARGDSAIVGEIKPGESWLCSGGCGTVAGGHVTACGTSSDRWYAISYYGYVRYVSATCGTVI
ncbi:MULTISPECIES: hypothetical protein [Streptomyces]|uniref:SH3 domain-containing protein n=1 Tax=Streptomyces rhizosphaericola TaxID=2564098 RepID=A0ABY2PB36_9ACTN|nr:MULTISPECIES: hypothetical protein [Streptomyces]ARI50823.1 hypothetical protein A6E92_00740 [Streptomyces sp. S8]MYT92057.1 hypothetical protein [Streptomyces sp. SID8359]MYT98884.1 hypothetical protein [Streptomyces sp. SID8350]NGO84621.1 hypothetical protein [Streptomyces sp. 196(2019)]TGZ06789.1 hypothetical protein E5Z02_21595 [Streptomyces rhizosphaericola]